MNNYNQVFKDYNLNGARKQQYLHKLLETGVLRIYLAVIYPHVNTSQQAVDQFSDE